MIIHIAAVAENQVIGKDNKMLWKLSKDFQRFKSLTMGNYIVMGRKTFESLPGVLPGRTHIVITRNDKYVAPEGVIVVRDIKEALSKCTYEKDVYIVGGGEIYAQTMNIADKLEITRVNAEYVGDTTYPLIDMSKWVRVNVEVHFKDEKNSDNFDFITYTRR